MGIRSLCGTIAPEEEEVVIATVQIEQGSHQHEARVSLAITHWSKSHPAKQESRMTKFALYVPIEAEARQGERSRGLSAVGGSVGERRTRNHLMVCDSRKDPPLSRYLIRSMTRLDATRTSTERSLPR